MKRPTKTLANWLDALGKDRVVISVLLLCTLLAALTWPVDPYPRDGWFESQYRLFGHFPGEDNYTPIAAPAIVYKLVHWGAVFLGWDLKGELYLASLVQNGLLFLSACLVYYTCKCVSRGSIAACVAVSYLLVVLSTGMAQAFWSENVVLVMYAAVLYLNLTIYCEAGEFTPVASSRAARSFWQRTVLSGLLTGLLVITRMTPIFLIPALCLLLRSRLGRRRLIGYTVITCVITSLLLGAMLASNYLRFGRTELTNSSGRHLWQGVTPIVDTALADSPEFLELRALNLNVEGANWYEIRLPNDSRREFDGEELFGRLAREVIRSHPFSYLHLGIVKFLSTIGHPLPPLGPGSKGTHHLLAADPLKTDRPLPPLGESFLHVPVLVAAARSVISAVFSIGQVGYPVAGFFVISTYAALMVGRMRVPTLGHRSQARRSGRVDFRITLHLLFGALLLGVFYVSHGYHDRFLVWLERILCALFLLIQVAVIGASDPLRAKEPSPGASQGDIIYTFLALVFFGLLWLNWQIEANATRYVIPYLPFFSAMLAMAFTYWLGVPGARRAVYDLADKAGSLRQ